MTDIKNVTVAGSGVLGSQIAYQSAYSGKNVTIYDISDDAVAKAKNRVKDLRSLYEHDLNIDDAEFEAGLENLSYSSDLADAVKDADLVIEAIPEKPEIKHSFYQQLAKVAPAKTIFASNSSTLIPSMFMDDTGRPEKFLNLHFANQVWLNNTAEVMGSPKTDPEIYKEIVEYAREIGMVPIQLQKEQPGYILNSLLIPFLNAGQELWTKGVADPQTIDKTWMKATGAPQGPFAILDVVGLRTAYNITATYAASTQDKQLQVVVDSIKKLLDEGKLGRESGEGFYKYPHPAFEDPDFLKI
ncbi:3-hydroxyacyl-CoA dehydrogenase [Secundilactobacillus collinoides]|mgnify:CR=1 FL=1|uniref:3-hydroxybutyryl-CoA dehydrogenase n=1 Tax=Secundilactobacillus collinoides TaxID=33960 RepID=A0A166H3H2_SECCO|nr:3-hydroxyacyl-CoA dehydrogenase [Secundilactobacillus collinoides]KZL41399.1 3-hydroxybutyryl-CoA dehydrogenase [Secundilactobacillus collinoides]